MLISTYLNWTPNALHLKEHVKRGIEEALIKGRGLLWSGTWMPPGSEHTYVGSSSTPSTTCSLTQIPNPWRTPGGSHARSASPSGRPRDDLDLKKGSLKANHESVNQQVEIDSGP